MRVHESVSAVVSGRRSSGIVSMLERVRLTEAEVGQLESKKADERKAVRQSCEILKKYFGLY